MRAGSCPQQPSRFMCRGTSGPLPIILALILLPTIAFASPPDPSWVAGFYDGADADDIVSLVYDTSAADAAAPLHLGPPPSLLDISLEGIICNVTGRLFTRGPRSPPVLNSHLSSSSCRSLHPERTLPAPFRRTPSPAIYTLEAMYRDGLNRPSSTEVRHDPSAPIRKPEGGEKTKGRKSAFGRFFDSWWRRDK